MLKLKITVRKDILYYKLPFYSKIPFAILLGILVWGMIDALAKTNFIMIFFLILSYGGVGYVESWEFNNKSQSIISKNGVFPFIKTTTIPYSTISRIDISHFYRGEREGEEPNKQKKRRRKAMIVLSLIDVKTTIPTKIEIIDEKSSGGRTESAAAQISSHCGIALEADRGPESGPNMKIKDLQKNMFDFH